MGGFFGCMRATQVARQHGSPPGRRTRQRSQGGGGGKAGPLAVFFNDARVLLWRIDVDDLGQLVNRFGKTNPLLGATDAGVTATDRPIVFAGIAKADGRAVGIGLWPLATQLVQAIALAVAGITKLHGETTGIKVRAALAVFMNQARIGKLRAPQLVHLR